MTAVAAVSAYRQPGVVRRNLGFVVAAILAIFWIAPIAILAMNAFKSPNDFLMTSNLTPPSTFNLFVNLQHFVDADCGRAGSEIPDLTGSPPCAVAADHQRIHADAASCASRSRAACSGSC